MKRLQILVIATILTVIATVAAARTVTITHSLDYKPYFFVDKNGNSQGLLTDYWRLWAKKVDVEIKFIPRDFNTCISMVKNGQADLVGGLFYNKERDRYLDFSKTFCDIDAILFVVTENPATTPEDLIGTVIGVVKGDYAEWFVKKYHRKLTLQTYTNYDDVIQAALQNKIKAFILDRPNALYLLSQHDSLSKFRQMQTLYTQSLRGGVKLGNSELVSLIDKGIDQINDSEIRKIYKRWTAYKPLFSKKLIRKLVIIGVIFVFALLILSTFILRRKVKQKTRNLQNALDNLHEKNAALTHEINEHKKTRQKKEKLADELKIISELVPICSHCKNIRNDNGYWEKIEIFMESRETIEFTHGICPECIAKLYPDLARSNKNNL